MFNARNRGSPYARATTGKRTKRFGFSPIRMSDDEDDFGLWQGELLLFWGLKVISQTYRSVLFKIVEIHT